MLENINLKMTQPDTNHTSAPPTLDPLAARRWRERHRRSTPWLHEEVAQRMLGRLDYIKAVPQQWLHWWPTLGGLEAHRQLQARLSGARDWVYESVPTHAQQTADRLTPPWWSGSRWRWGRVGVFSDATPKVDMLWSNMGLHTDPSPVQTLRRWRDALKVDGFLMFSCLGPDTLTELGDVYRELSWPAPSHEFTDMHDLGDMLVEAGFSEPVMSMERLQLTYSSAEALLAELRTLGRNLSRDRFASMRGRVWRAKWLEEVSRRLKHPAHDGRLALTFEVIYGHAYGISQSAGASKEGQAIVPLDQVRAALASSRRRTP